jgi:hypothetical protein
VTNQYRNYKFEWALQQLQALEHQIGVWRAQGGYGVIFEPQPNRAEHIMRLKADEPPVALSLIIGDALHSLRSGLDHLAYALAQAESGPNLPPQIAKGIEFPIFGDKPMNPGEEKKRIGPLNPQARAVILGLQPHQRGAAYVDDPLWHLHELARVDRHRLLHLTVAVLGHIGVGGDNVHIERMKFGRIGPDLKDGAELGICSVRPINPGLPMHMQVTAGPEITFQDGIGAGQPVLSSFREIVRHDSNVLGPLLQFLP